MADQLDALGQRIAELEAHENIDDRVTAIEKSIADINVSVAVLNHNSTTMSDEAKIARETLGKVQLSLTSVCADYRWIKWLLLIVAGSDLMDILKTWINPNFSVGDIFNLVKMITGW